MSDEQSEQNQKRMAERSNNNRRQEKRCVVSTVYHQYILLYVIAGSSLIPAVLNNFSCHGILFECTEVLDAGTHAERVLSVRRLLSQDISFAKP
jgi:hypothetical protein